jgi:hypothetical protein
VALTMVYPRFILFLSPLPFFPLQGSSVPVLNQKDCEDVLMDFDDLKSRGSGTSSLPPSLPPSLPFSFPPRFPIPPPLLFLFWKSKLT